MRARFGLRAEAVEPLASGYRLRLRDGKHPVSLRARSVVVALPAYAAARAKPVFASVCYWRQGLPQPELGHVGNIEALRRLEEQWPGLFVTGNYVSGVSTAACIDAALATAARAGKSPPSARVPAAALGA